jgi:hypothetical protein
MTTLLAPQAILSLQPHQPYRSEEFVNSLYSAFALKKAIRVMANLNLGLAFPEGVGNNQPCAQLHRGLSALIRRGAKLQEEYRRGYSGETKHL